jgi:hypothetical protein
MAPIVKSRDSTTQATLTHGAKRNQSEGSTPSSAGSNPQRAQKKPKREGQAEAGPSTSTQGVTGDTYSQALTALKMEVVLEGFPEKKMTEEQSKKIQQAVLGEVWKCDPGTGL